MTCPSCSKEVPEGSNFCSFCGAPLGIDSTPTLSRADAPAGRTPQVRVRTSPRTGHLSSSSSLDEARFVPGTALADRYRIVALMGKGGMGEVYRADDLKLGQAVALKFLPDAVAQDGAALARLHREVRMARQVSHPNVCRVFDIGEADGLPFLSMEYVDGEDLASLLRRIGRLPQDKALEIARQLCAGLAAAHENGVLHRDLKHANVMIDGRGKARITDFGLAGLADDLRGGEARGGTPAYMAPEQLAGKEASVKSDIYSLGLVLYELFTGKRAFDAATLAELRRLHEQTTPSSPSTLVKEMDPLVERVILRCLEKDPGKRPASAIQVAAALPGGDPLAAALAAGETPSPEMVAASGETESLRPAAAWACLAVVVVGAIATVFLGAQTKLYPRVGLEKPPDVLAERAKEIARKSGYSEPPTDRAFGFTQDEEYLRYIGEHDKSKTRWNNLDRGAIKFWYRQSPRELAAQRSFTTEFPGGDVSANDPPLDVSGMATVWLDPRGRLLKLEAVPPQVEEAAAPASAPNWSLLFSEADLDLAKWTASEPRWTPRAYSDFRAAWVGSLPERPDVPMRIEAAVYRGKPVYFELVGPWTRAERMNPYQLTRGEKVSAAILIVLLIAVLVGGVLLARRNLRLGRGDRRGASRLALFILLITTVAWIFNANHVPTPYELALFFMFAGGALLIAGILWVLYTALEPYVRRHWPTTLISWSRLLAGSVRDPLVGRDILAGCVAGTTVALVSGLARLLPPWLGSPPPRPVWLSARPLLGARGIIAQVMSDLVTVVLAGLVFLFLLFLFRTILRRQWAAAAALILIFTIPTVLQSDTPVVLGINAAIANGLIIFILMRFGLVAAIGMFFCNGLLQRFPITPHASVWYAVIGFSALAVLAAVAFYSFYISLGGRPAFGSAALVD